MIWSQNTKPGVSGSGHSSDAYKKYAKEALPKAKAMMDELRAMGSDSGANFDWLIKSLEKHS